MTTTEMTKFLDQIYGLNKNVRPVFRDEGDKYWKEYHERGLDQFMIYGTYIILPTMKTKKVGSAAAICKVKNCYCLQYRGNGHYFDDTESGLYKLIAYAIARGCLSFRWPMHDIDGPESALSKIIDCIVEYMEQVEPLDDKDMHEA